MSLRKLAVASTIATFLLIGMGGLVRATKSGLGCGDDWPACNGELVPAMQTYTTLIEWLHRLAALAVVILLGALVVVAHRAYKGRSAILGGSYAAFALVIVQSLVGMLVVKLELEAFSVVLHLGLALGLGALLIHVSTAVARADGDLDAAVDPGVSHRAWVAAAAVLALVLVGSYVRGIGAGSVFPDWPLMDGKLVPDLSSEPSALHFLHRSLAVVAAAAVTFAVVPVIRRRRELPVAARFAHAAAGLFAVEVVVGAVNVWTEVDLAAVRALHLFVGVLVWGALTAIAAVTGYSMRAVGAGRASPSLALEGET